MLRNGRARQLEAHTGVSPVILVVVGQWCLPKEATIMAGHRLKPITRTQFTKSNDFGQEVAVLCLLQGC